MKRASLISLVVLTITGCDKFSGSEAETAPMVLETQGQQISYLLGMDNGKGIQSTGIELNVEAYQQGFVDGVEDKQSQLSEEQTAEAIKAFQEQMIAKREEMQKAQKEALELEGSANLGAGKEFLKANAAKEGVVTTESGLQYKVITEGTGAKPTKESIVEVHYAGRLLDGTEFDSSLKRGVPVQFGVTQVIAGWTEALQLMPEGSKWELYIPADLAYGAGGQGPIGPNSVLIFEVELLKANYKKPEKG